MQESGLLADSLSDMSIAETEKPVHQDHIRVPPPSIRTSKPAAEPVSPTFGFETAHESKGQDAGSISVNTHLPAATDQDSGSGKGKQPQAEQEYDADRLEEDALPAVTESGLSETRSKSL